MTAPDRIEPGIVLVGGMRCGSTSLFRHLGSHPDVHESAAKETRFFDRNYERGWDWYEERLGEPAPGTVVFEATPSYLVSPVALERLAVELPAAQLIVTMRDPVERASSHYWMFRERGHEDLELAEAFEAELGRSTTTDAGLERRYLLGGMYGPQLRQLLELFPAEQVHAVA
ncbi:MAG: sulfotransferase, partial [Actinomycetota bacterium]